MIVPIGTPGRRGLSRIGVSVLGEPVVARPANVSHRGPDFVIFASFVALIGLRGYCIPSASAMITATAPSAVSIAHHSAAKRSHSS
jgi:hypothetical protein